MNPLLLLFVLPLLEIAVFVEVGDAIGAWPTVGLVVLAAVVGSLLLRTQGLSVLRRAQMAAQRGEAPVGAVFEGFCVVVAAVLLMIPGFISDAIGLLLFVPAVRNRLGRWLLDRLQRSGAMRVWTAGAGPQQRPGHRPRPFDAGQPGVIDGEYREIDPEPGNAPTIGESRWGSGPKEPGER